jgi:hypothetical protein
MRRFLITPALLGSVLIGPATAQAHCDSIGGPVTTAALKALDTNNVNVILPYVPASAEPELTATFEQVMPVRTLGPDAKALADRHFMEAAVRMHRAGEDAPYTGLKPAGTDFGPAIPAAEKALESGQIEPLIALLSKELSHGLAERFEHAIAAKETKEATSAAGVPAARERVSEELRFIGYVEGIYLATIEDGHMEGVVAAKDCGH